MPSLTKPFLTLADVGGNAKTLEALKTLHPVMQDRMVAALQDLAAQGEKVHIAFTYRSKEEQDAIFARKDGSTSKPGGFSYHNHGLAINLIPVENGKATYEPKDKGAYARIANIVRPHGFVWGSDPGATGIGIDQPHHQYAGYPHHTQTEQLFARIARGEKQIIDGKVFPVLPNEEAHLAASARHLEAWRKDRTILPFDPALIQPMVEKKAAMEQSHHAIQIEPSAASHLPAKPRGGHSR